MAHKNVEISENHIERHQFQCFKELIDVNGIDRTIK